jgi:hypothetical protein
MDTVRDTSEWSEKGHGQIRQDEINGAQAKGTPIRSILEDKELSGLDQVKDLTPG